ASSILSIEPPGMSPALLTRMSMSAASLARFARSSGLRTYTPWAVAPLLRVAQLHDMAGRADLVRGAQPLGKRFQLLAVAGGQHDVAAFLGKGFGRGRAHALWGAGYTTP